MRHREVYILHTVPLLALALAAALAGTLAGCYDYPVPRDPTASSRPIVATTQNVTSRSGFVHAPYAAGKCKSCHDRQSDVFESAAQADVCITCHTQVPTAHRVMHGPVLAGACTKCHAPHESALPLLLVGNGRMICTQCHEWSTMHCTTKGKGSSKRDCLECHFAHGGETSNFLRPPPARPTTKPTTRHMVAAEH